MPSADQKNVIPLCLRAPWVSAMRSRVRNFAHVLERIGLAMAGAASGLFVGAHVGTSFAALTSEGFLLLMMAGGAIGFYLGIDAPQMAFHSENGNPSSSKTQIDAAEFLSAVGPTATVDEITTMPISDKMPCHAMAARAPENRPAE